MKLSSEIFRQYDIRGVVGHGLNAEIAHALGRAIATELIRGGGKRLVVGRDGRSSGKSLEDPFVDGVRGSGIDVDRIGVVPTPLGYWAIQHLTADGGVVITGSHNPPEYNGFKITLLGRSLWGEDIQRLRHLIESEDFAAGYGDERQVNVLDTYVSELAENLGVAERPLKVVVDAGNGVGGLTAVPLYKKLGYDVTPLFVEVDGDFPNHHADPTVESNLTALRSKVAEIGADLGIAFDGDGDRIGVVDEMGGVIWGDRLMILLARDVLREAPGSVVIGEVKCSKTLYDAIAAAGGKPLMWITGHSLIKEKMRETGAALAGEMSGHIFFKHRYYGFDDATYAGGRLLELLSRSDRRLSELLADVPTMESTPELRVACPEDKKFAVVESVLERFQHAEAKEGYRVIDIDGVRVEWSDGWGLLRASNTTPLLVLRFEAESAERLAEIREIFDAELNSVFKKHGVAT